MVRGVHRQETLLPNFLTSEGGEGGKGGGEIFFDWTGELLLIQLAR